ncbi:MAG TPA: sigma-70 family RNA polymerase sigma factor [Candidatus Avanaerovorax faecigallinarum]|nr:sigma-70 family RNA polymerase sigma factor [Candidatus Avanaerovorax faecigallinarum]
MESKAYYSSFEEMYLDNYKLVILFIRDYITDPYLVQDISSIVWTKVAEHIERCISMDRLWLRNYLRVMVRNTVADQYREEKAIKELQEKIQDILKYTAVHPTEENDGKEYLRGAIAMLSDEEIQLLYLKYEKMLNSEEIGAMLGVGSGAVRMRHKRIVEKLRKKINELRAENGDA